MITSKKRRKVVASFYINKKETKSEDRKADITFKSKMDFTIRCEHAGCIFALIQLDLYRGEVFHVLVRL